MRPNVFPVWFHFGSRDSRNFSYTNTERIIYSFFFNVKITYRHCLSSPHVASRLTFISRDHLFLFKNIYPRHNPFYRYCRKDSAE